MTQILVFGDSITYGAWDLEGGWVARLRKWIDMKNISDPENFFCTIYNLGYSGDTSTELLKRFENEIYARFWEAHKDRITMISIGTNDSSFLNKTKRTSTGINQFKENLKKLLKISKKFSTKTIFVGLTPVDESKLDPVPWNTEISCKNKYVKEFDKAIKEFCSKNKLLFIELFDELLKIDYKKLLQDGEHPNSEGHKIIFEIVKKNLVNNKIIDV